MVNGITHISQSLINGGYITMKTQKTILGLNQNIAGILCYLFTWISGLIFFLLEKENKFVRFHGLQSTIFFISLSILGLLVASVPLIGPVICSILYFFGLLAWIFLMFKAFLGETFKIPLIGDIVEEYI